MESTMKAIQVNAPGGPEALVFQDVARPAPARGEVLVKVAAIGVNYMDVYKRKGLYGAQAPYLLGGEAAGLVEELGEDVRDARIGDRVAFCGVSNTYAQYVSVPANKLIHVPASMSFEEAAAFPLQGMTAHYLIHEFHHVHAGTTVLIHAIAGGVGLLLAQMAYHMNAHVIGTTSSGEKATNAREAGAHDVILYTKQNFVEEVKRITNGRGVDLILDSVGKTTFAGDLEAVRVRGTIVIYGSSSGPADPIVPNSLMARSITLCGGSLPNFTQDREELIRRSTEVLNGLREGWLTLRIDRTLPLSQAVEAHRLLESRQTSGKLILVP